jgi:predicted nucleotidyltransferase
MRFRNNLDEILGQRTKIKALRYLINHNKEVSIRALSRAIRVTPPNLAIILADLKKEGVLTNKEYGRSMVYAVNHGHYLVGQILLPLFKHEREALSELKKIIKRKFKFSYESIILFGSVAVGSEHPSSDIDLLIVINNQKDKDAVEQNILDVNDDVLGIFGNQLSPYILSKKEFALKYKNKDSLILKIARDGEVLDGKLIGELL